MIRHELLNTYEVNLKNENVKKTVEMTLKYYVHRALIFKYMYYILSILAVVLNASIPVLSQINWVQNKLMVTIISSVVTVITSVQALIRLKESWIRYRGCAEALKSECVQFNGNINEYNDEDLEEKERIFIMNFEKINQAERLQWKDNAVKKGVVGNTE